MTRQLYQQLQQADPDRALLSLRVDADKRPAVWALFLFNQEIARIRESVTDTTLGLIRLQWWRDNILEGRAQAHPLLPYLLQARTEFDLPLDDFETLLYAREFDLSGVPPANLGGLVNYADFTNTSLLRLALRMAGQEWSHPSLQHIAIAYGLTGLMRAVIHHAGQGRCFLPSDLMATQGITEANLYAGKAAKALPAIIAPVLDEAKRQLDLATSVGGRCPPLLRAAKATAQLYAHVMLKAGSDPLQPAFHRPPFAAKLRILTE